MIRLMLSLALPDVRLVFMDPADLICRLGLLASPVIVAHPRERKDIRSGREA